MKRHESHPCFFVNVMCFNTYGCLSQAFWHVLCGDGQVQLIVVLGICAEVHCWIWRFVLLASQALSLQDVACEALLDGEWQNMRWWLPPL